MEIWNASKYSFSICIIYSFHLLYCWFQFPYDFYVIEKQISEYLKWYNENCWKYYWHYLTTLWQACPSQLHMEMNMVIRFMLNCLLLTNSSVKHSLSIYLIIIIIIIIIIIRYFCSYNTGWDEKQVLFTRLITILFHGTHLHLYPR